MEFFKRFGFDKPLFFTTLILVVFGLIMIFSSSAILASEKYDRPFHFFLQQLTGAFIGMCLILMIITTSNPFYENAFFIYGLLFLSLVLLIGCLIMPPVANTNRWIHFFGLRFQPSELAKISLILFLSSYIKKTKEKLSEVKTLVFPVGVLALFISLVIKEPDYGTALVIFVISAIMLFIGGLRLQYFLFLSVISIALFVAYLFQAKYRIDRVIAFLSPANDPLGAGFQASQSKLAIGSGGLLGVSIGESSQKMFFLPCAHTDYIFAIIGEELGLIGTMGVLFLLGVLFWRGLVIAKKAPNLFCRILATGLTMAICSQAFLNISIVLGLGPATGLPLPLFSYGRSSLMCTLFGIGMLLHISQRKTFVGRYG